MVRSGAGNIHRWFWMPICNTKKSRRPYRNEQIILRIRLDDLVKVMTTYFHQWDSAKFRGNAEGRSPRVYYDEFPFRVFRFRGVKCLVPLGRWLDSLQILRCCCRSGSRLRASPITAILIRVTVIGRWSEIFVRRNYDWWFCGRTMYDAENGNDESLWRVSWSVFST